MFLFDRLDAVRDTNRARAAESLVHFTHVVLGVRSIPEDVLVATQRSVEVGELVTVPAQYAKLPAVLGAWLVINGFARKAEVTRFDSILSETAKWLFPSELAA